MYVLLGSYAFFGAPVAGSMVLSMTPPFSARPNRQFTFLRQGSSSKPAGLMFALTTVETAPTPCSRTGFHISSISL